MATGRLWPRLTFPAPDDALGHLGALEEDFRNIYKHVESGPGRMIQPAIFDQLYQSFGEFGRKVRTQLHYRSAFRHRHSRKIRLAKHICAPDAPDKETELRTRLTESNPQEKLNTGSSNDHNCFTIPIKDKRIIRLIQSLPQEQLRRLICRASGKDPDTPTAPCGQIVNQNETGDIEVHCSTKEEGRAFTKHRKWLRGFETFVGANVPVYAIRIDDVPVNSWNRQKDTPHNILAEQLAEVNIEPMATMQSSTDIISVVRTTKAPENQMVQVLIEFSKPKIANEAIAKGVVWIDKQTHKCTRQIRDNEVPECNICHGFSCNNNCRNGTHCGNCFAPHATNECAIDTAHCVLCDQIHKLSGTLCERKCADLERAKENVRLKQPLFSISAATASSPSTGAQTAISEANGSETSDLRPPITRLDETRRSDPPDVPRNAPNTASSSRRVDEHTAGAMSTQPTNSNDRQEQRTATQTISSNSVLPHRPLPFVNPGAEESRKRKVPEFASATEIERENDRSKRPQTSTSHHDRSFEDATQSLRHMIQQHGAHIGQGETSRARDRNTLLAHRPEWRTTGMIHHDTSIYPDSYVSQFLKMLPRSILTIVLGTHLPSKMCWRGTHARGRLILRLIHPVLIIRPMQLLGAISISEWVDSESS